MMFHFVTSFGVFEVFSEPFVGLNKASVKSERQIIVTSIQKIHETLPGTCKVNQSEKPDTCECSGDVVLDLDVHKESRQS